MTKANWGTRSGVVPLPAGLDGPTYPRPLTGVAQVDPSSEANGLRQLSLE